MLGDKDLAIRPVTVVGVALGTTGSKLSIPSLPEVSSSLLPGVEVEGLVAFALGVSNPSANISANDVVIKVSVVDASGTEVDSVNVTLPAINAGRHYCTFLPKLLYAVPSSRLQVTVTDAAASATSADITLFVATSMKRAETRQVIGTSVV